MDNNKQDPGQILAQSKKLADDTKSLLKEADDLETVEEVEAVADSYKAAAAEEYANNMKKISDEVDSLEDGMAKFEEDKGLESARESLKD